jgi:hypothetical protein
MSTPSWYDDEFGSIRSIPFGLVDEVEVLDINRQGTTAAATTTADVVL